MGTVAENMGDRLGQAIRQKPGSRRSQLVLDYTNGLSTGSKTALRQGKVYDTDRQRVPIGRRQFPPIVNELLHITEKLTVHSTEE